MVSLADKKSQDSTQFFQNFELLLNDKINQILKERAMQGLSKSAKMFSLLQNPVNLKNSKHGKKYLNAC
jgi:hypothetical protein